MNPKTNVKKHNTKLNYHYGFNNNDFANPKPKVRTQVPNHDKSPNKTSMLGPTSKQPNKQKSNKTQFPPINPEPNKFQNIKNEINNHFYNSPGKEIPNTEIKRDKMDIDDKYKKKIGTAIIPKNNNKMDIDDEYDSNKGKAITSVKNNKINKNNLQDKKVGKESTTIKNNKMNYDYEKDEHIEKPKTEIKPNKKNRDTTPKINQNKIQNQKEKESEVNNLYINSINDVRLPKGLVDISFDELKAE